MTLHDQIRRDQSLVLRDSLLGSSFSWLTVAVAVLFVASLRTPLVIDEPPPAPWVLDERVLTEILVINDGVPAVPIVIPPTQVDGRLVPVDDESLREAPASVAVPITDPSAAALQSGNAVVGSPGRGAGEGATTPAAGEIPAAGIWIYRDVDPEVATRVTPLYPELARQARIEGRLVVRAFVGPDGRVRRAEVESGPEIFAEAATTAVERWVFTPALANGHPVGVWVRVPVLFRLD